MEPMKLLEIVGRVLIIYAALLLMLRLAGRREMSEMSPMDLLTMLLVSETVSPALTGGEEGIPGGLVAAATLLATSVALSVLGYRSRLADRLIEGEATLLIRNGRVDGRAMKRFRITDGDLRTALHQHGLLSVREVAVAYVEPDGEITMIKEKDIEEARALNRGSMATRDATAR